MGFPRYLVERPGTPILAIHEQHSVISAVAPLTVRNRVRKLIFILEGECCHRIMDAPGDHGFVLRTGDVLVVPFACQQEYSALHAGGATRLLTIRLALDPQVIPPLPISSHPGFPAHGGEVESDLTVFAAQQFRTLRHLPGAQSGIIREALGQWREEAQTRQPGYRLRVHALCESLLTLVARQLMGGPLASTGGAGQIHHIATAKDYLLRHLSTPLSLGQVAAHVRLSEPYLARLFKEVTGQTVFDYVREQRIEAAKTLLSGTPLNAGEIARRTGFGSPEVFSRTFKRGTGLSPSQYRRQLVDGDDDLGTVS